MKLEFFFIARHVPGQVAQRHGHKALEIVYCLEGSGTSAMKGRTHRVGPDLFTITPRGTHHDQKSTTAVITACFGVTGSGLEQFTGSWPDTDGRIRRLCLEFCAEMDGRAAGHQEVCAGLLAAMVARRFKHPLLEPVLDFAGYWFKHRPFITFHDPLAAVTVFEPSLCTYRTGQVAIETGYPDLNGRTFWQDDKKGPHQAAVTVDAERFFKKYFEVFGK
jgi:hypothetical protein